MSLPPVPDSSYVKHFDGMLWMAYTPKDMKAYGKACREAALEEAHTQCLYVSDATSEGHSALASPSSAAEDCADRIRNLK